MKLLVIIFLLCAAACATNRAGEVTVTTARTAVSAAATASQRNRSSDDNAVQTLMQLEHDRAKALLNHDTTRLDQIFAASYLYTDHHANQFTKAQTLDNLNSGALKFAAFEVKEMNVYFYGDAAAVFETYKCKSSYQGEAFDDELRGTDFFVRQDHHWVAVATHTSRVTKK